MIKDAFGMNLPLEPANCVFIYALAARFVDNGIACDTSCYAIDEAHRLVNNRQAFGKHFEASNLKLLFASYFKPIGSSSAYWFDEDELLPSKEMKKAENDHRVIALLFMAEICKDMDEGIYERCK